jgi:hypothetical protein
MRCFLHISVILGFWSMSLAPWQTTPPDGLVTLRAIRQKMTQNLARIPNYTCLETIRRDGRPPERFVVAAHGKPVPFTRLDVVRLEVAEVAGAELYARAGDHAFSAPHPKDFVSSGLIGNGAFSSFTHEVFESEIAAFQPMREERIGGRAELRYDFRVPRSLSGFTVGTELRHQIVAYHGTFAADPVTLDAEWLEIVADDVPVVTSLTAASARVEYSRVRIGSADPLLPQSGEMTTRRADGWENRNQIAFSHCRAYGVQASITFDDAAGATDEAATTIDLPANLELTIRLETPIDSANAHVGDAITARVDADVSHKGVLVVPRDAFLSGRVRSLAQHSDGTARSVVDLEWTQIEFGGKRARFFAVLQKVAAPGGTQRLRVGPAAIPLPGVGSVSGAGDRLRLPAGTKMIWKTIP